MALDKKLKATYDAMSRTELKKVEQDLFETRDMVALTYIRNVLELSDQEPIKIRRNTILALIMVSALSILLITAAFIVPIVSAWLNT